MTICLLGLSLQGGRLARLEQDFPNMPLLLTAVHRRSSTAEVTCMFLRGCICVCKSWSKNNQPPKTLKTVDFSGWNALLWQIPSVWIQEADRWTAKHTRTEAATPYKQPEIISPLRQHHTETFGKGVALLYSDSHHVLPCFSIQMFSQWAVLLCFPMKAGGGGGRNAAGCLLLWLSNPVAIRQSGPV